MIDALLGNRWLVRALLPSPYFPYASRIFDSRFEERVLVRGDAVADGHFAITHTKWLSLFPYFVETPLMMGQRHYNELVSRGHQSGNRFS